MSSTEHGPATTGATAVPAAPTAVLEARGLVKRYGSVTAIDGADFELRAGEVLAVIGDNGAGKSSLIKVLAGAVVPDAGEIRMDGRPVTFHNTRFAGTATVTIIPEPSSAVVLLVMMSSVIAVTCWRR